MKKKVERGESTMQLLSRAVRDSTLMTNLALNIRERTAKIKPGRLRWYCLGALLALWAGETWFCTTLFGPIGKIPHYESIRPMVTEKGGNTPVLSFREWDSVLANPGVRKHWDSLLRQRQGLADSIKQLLRLDVAHGVK
ncbi:MAG TPA: hypothetical protein VFE32_21620 [Puia sp.]|nr:hypothetical protein [Puia sp.]